MLLVNRNAIVQLGSRAEPIRSTDGGTEYVPDSGNFRPQSGRFYTFSEIAYRHGVCSTLYFFASSTGV